MLKRIFLFLFLILHSGLQAQYDGGYAGGRQAAMGGCAVPLQETWSVLNNPAGMATAEQVSAGIFYRNRYKMMDMDDRGAAVMVPTGLGNFGLGFSYYGFNVYNEKRIVLGYGRKLWPDVRAGLSFDYLHTQLNDQRGNLTGSKGVMTFQGGIQASLSDQIDLGFSVFNPWAAELSKYENQKIPAMARLGFSYKAGDKFLIVVSAEQDLDHELRIKSGVEYELMNEIDLRGGIKTNPAEYTFGVGLKFSGFVFDVSTAYHLKLGNSPHGSFQYEF